MKSEIKFRAETVSYGSADITPVIRLHLHCFKLKQALAFHVLFEPVYIKINYAGASRIFRTDGEAIPLEQFEKESPGLCLTDYPNNPQP